ncbi:hypothetical protein GCM10011348_35310 [Marinobacterium nitratireducens]|uniref:Membrane-anchored protein n=1 Tax=Marinobacterium nitratireducens TaxID=518897 RepID=A0A917ZL60_9GAMM|nr:DUF3422 domain-containing protein [Marinobacterium nitratireducens]GGO85837.1 hypothetical protein GCM10011348_35310 [Marinobacterium nitratireducens]
MQSHPLRDQIIAEVHARPFQQMSAPLALLQVAILHEDKSPEEIDATVRRLACEAGYDVGAGAPGFFFTRKGSEALRYEPHSEFYSLTLYHFGDLEVPVLPEAWADQLPGAFLCGVEVLFRQQGVDFDDWVAGSFGGFQVSGADVMDRAATLRTDFQVRADTGYNRVLVEDREGMNLYRAGRLLQRICEIETYRHMALLALPLALETVPRVTELDQQLAAVVERIAESQSEPSTLLQELMALAAQVETLSARTANRLSATEAYFALVERRIAELRETRIEGLQTVEQFMERRLDPAHRTCRSTGERIDRLSQRISRSTELIRSQVDLSIENQSRDLLQGINRRARSQLRLQAKLESFTVIVVTYYAFDLIDRTSRNLLEDHSLEDKASYFLSASVPLIALVLFWYVRRMLKGVDKDD